MSRLPSAYQEVEYIENTGRQYINTGITPDNDTDVGVTASDVTETSAQIFAAGGTYRIVKFSANRLIGATIGSTSIPSSSSGADKFTAKIENKTFYFNGTVIGSSTDTISTSYTLELFRGNYGGSAQYYSKFKCYGAYVKQNGELILYLVPCYRKSDNEIGMYDLINNVFYTNSGTETFTKGADVLYGQLGSIE